MAQRDKLLARFRQRPPLSDLTWGELVRLLEGLGFSLENGGGSRRCFVGNFQGVVRRINVHEPHPSGILKAYVVRLVVKSLEDYQLI